ncbi:hypothetical protein EHQ53_11995 [Leptospira langatensis]|uniref:Uncharacterized protein n=1 Tax=Leptospira langatensis TaxID=2484983 RepID=A0A5F1ZUN4_9LEPT|nr:hypothetical protein EHO57_14505 [Leptospira langatensis]TGL40699.1 hypothetical protein EHQ53_11995 [Leptospira langatensis]
MTGIGHLSSAFLVKSKFKDVPLWILLISTEVVELVWIVLNLNPFGFSPPLEFMKIELPFLYIGNMKLLSQQYSHSLVGGILIGIVFFFLLKSLKVSSATRYIAVALAASGHWFLDLLVHDHDLKLLPLSSAPIIGPIVSLDPSNPELGISAAAPLLGFAIQAILSAIGAYVFTKNFEFPAEHGKRNFIIGIIVLNLFSLPIFVKGMMTLVIRSEAWMAGIVFADMLFAAIVILYLSKTVIAKESSR